MKATKKATKRWLLELMARQAPQSVDDAQRNAETAAPSFSTRFEAAAFCMQSQDEIAGSVRYWNEAQVSSALEAWCKEHLATPGSESTLPPEADIAPLSVLGKHLYARFLKTSDDRAAQSALLMMQTVDPPSFRWVADHDFRAADIIVIAGWDLDGSTRAEDWKDEGVVRDSAITLMNAYSDAIRTQPQHSAGLANFRNLSALTWMCASTALTNAVSAHARESLPIVQEEMEAARSGRRRRPRLFE